MRKYTTRDESTGEVSQENQNLTLQAVLEITDWSAAQADAIANMIPGQYVNFDGISVERTDKGSKTGQLELPGVPAKEVHPQSDEIAHHITSILNVIEGGCDGMLLRPGLIETPDRVAKAYETWFGGYVIDIPAIFKTFEDGAEGSNELVIVRDIPVYSHCEHHMAPIIGRATVGYVPNGKIVGLSKLSRVVDAYMRRLQVQERLTNQIADAVFEHTGAKAVCVYIDARHMCMESRGVKQSCGSSTVTKAFRGATAGEYSGVQPLWSTEGLMWRREFLEACK